MTVLSVESLEDYEKYLTEAKTDQVVLIDFYATWCPPCRAIAPYLDELSNEHVDILFLKVDVDKVKDVAKKEAINCMPTFVCYVNQTQTAKLEGADKQRIKDVIDNNGIATLAPPSNRNYTQIVMWVFLAIYYCYQNGLFKQWAEYVQNMLN